jgi:branched-chain amino acid transport system ATP-binding protein
MLLEVANVTTGYGPTIVNRNVSVVLRAGEIATILGPNGAGKTTLLKTIAGLVKPRSGTVTFDGRDMTGHPPDAMARRGVVLVPEGRRIFGDMTVEENLRLGAYTRRDAAAIDSDITLMEGFFPILAAKRKDRGGSLSGGQQQMLAIGRGLASSPKLLMLDEPSMGLAPSIADFIFERLIEIRQQSKLTILLVEQRVAEALESADHGYVLEAGRVALEGNNQTLRADDRVRKAYLGM